MLGIGSEKGNTMKKIFTTLFVMLSISCSGDFGQTWNFKWSFLNRTDSTSVVLNLKPDIDIESERFDPLPENVKFSPNGILTFIVYIQGSERYVEMFPSNAKLHVQLLLNDSVPFDTLFRWNELEFVKGDDENGNKNQSVNYKTFFLK
jgi:hypothetical protein